MQGLFEKFFCFFLCRVVRLCGSLWAAASVQPPKVNRQALLRKMQRSEFIFQTSPHSLADVFTRKHRSIPIPVGIRRAAAVHFKLPLSFLIVISVVEQGQ